jgi:uncharacterized protein (TIGR02594 family)
MTEPLLLRVARLCIGLVEAPGAGNSPVIMQWARDLGVGAIYPADSVPWCAVFLNRICMAAGYPLAGRSYDLLRAKSFEAWGEAIAAPALGAVLVFSRPEGAHVGLYLGETDDAYRVLGGNQANAVNEIWIAKSRLRAIRWPSGLALPTGGRVLLKSDGRPVSNNEA